MKFFKRLLMIAMLVIVLLTGVGFMLPESYSVERKIEINSQSDLVFTELNNLFNWNQWSPWKNDSKRGLPIFSTIAIGEGAWQNWKNNSYGEGQIAIKRVTQGKKILYELLLKDYNITSTGEFFLESVHENRTIVTWKDNYIAGNNIIHRYFGLFANYVLGADLEQGLKELKNKLENKNNKL